MKRLLVRIQRVCLPLLKFVPGPLLARLARFSSPAFRVGASAAILNASGELLLVRHSYRHGWGLPGGSLGRAENPAEAIQRELREELGLELEANGSLQWFLNQRWRRVETVFSMDVGEQSPVISSPEIAEVGWFSLDDLPELERYLTVVLEQVLGRSVSSAGEVAAPRWRAAKRQPDDQVRWFGPSDNED